MPLRPGFQLDTSPTAITEYRILHAESVEGLQAKLAAAIAQGLTPIGQIQRDHNGGFLQPVGVPVAAPPAGSSAVLFAAGGSAATGINTVQPYATSTSAGIGGSLTAYDAGLESLALGFSIYGIPAFAPGVIFVGAMDDLNEGDITARVIALSAGPTGVARLTGSVQLLAANGHMPAVAFDSAAGLAYAFAADGAGATGQFALAAVQVTGGAIAQVGATLVDALGFNILSPNGDVAGATVIDGHLCLAVADAAAGSYRKRMVSFDFDGTNFTQVDTLAPTGNFYSFIAGPTWLAGVSDSTITFFTYTAAGGFVEAFTVDPTTLDSGGLLTALNTTVYDPVADRFHIGITDGDYTAGAIFVATPNFGTSSLTLVARIDGLPEAQWSPYFAYGNSVWLPSPDWNDVVMANFTGTDYEFLAGAYTGAPAEFFLLPLIEA